MMEIVFFCSDIHATDATQTGCTAKTAAANHANGIESLSNTRQTKTTASA